MVERIKEIPVQQGIQSNGEDMKAFTYRVTGALRGKYNYKGGEKMGSLPCRKKKKSTFQAQRIGCTKATKSQRNMESW